MYAKLVQVKNFDLGKNWPSLSPSSASAIFKCNLQNVF